jgi:hypothetical protein
VASIPSSIPTLIVPANSAIRQQNAGTGNENDPLKDNTLISLLLNGEQFPWLFVVSPQGWRGDRATDSLGRLVGRYQSALQHLPDLDQLCS